MFEPYLKSFYIRSTDPTQIKILKVSDGRTCTPPFRLTPTPADPLGYPRGHRGACLFLGLGPWLLQPEVFAQEARLLRVERELLLAYHLLDICHFLHVK